MLATQDPNDAINYTTHRLIQQGSPSYLQRNASGGYGGFAYRGYNRAGEPASCSIGWLLLDSEYLPLFEGYSIHFILTNPLLQGNGAVSRLRTYPRGLLNAMQHAHAVAAWEWNKQSPSMWGNIICANMRKVAQTFGLNHGP